MTGRQLLRRPGYDIDVEKVLAACAEHTVAVETHMRILHFALLARSPPQRN
jgi:hypothetical protein